MRSLIAVIICLVLFSPALTIADLQQCTSTAGSQVNLCNPAKTGVATVTSALTWIAEVFGLIIGLQAIIMVLFAGFRMIMSQGNEEEITKSKSALQWTLSGFILSLFAFALIAAIAKVLGVQDVPEGTLPVQNPLGNGSVFYDLIVRMIKGFLGIAGLMAVLMIIISGFRYVTAQGNEEQTTQARQGLQWAVIGLIVSALAYTIVVATAKLFGASVTT